MEKVPARAWFAALALLLAQMLSFADRTILSLPVEPIKADLQLTEVQMGLLLGISFALFYTVLGLPIAVLADGSSRKRILVIGMALWTAATASCGLARSFPALFFSRMAVGVGEASLTPTAYSLLGDLFLKAAIGRFTRTFGTLLSSGVPMLPALVITRDTSGNVHVANAINLVHDRVKEGDSVARPLESTQIFPGMVTSMIEVGEETGALPDMLTRIADAYEEEVDTAVAGLTSIIEPIMIVFMAVVVGTIVIALFLPIVRIVQSLT